MLKISYKNEKQRGRRRKRPTVTELNTLYIEQDMTASQIAEIYNVKPQTVRKWISFYRNNPEA